MCILNMMKVQLVFKLKLTHVLCYAMWLMNWCIKKKKKTDYLLTNWQRSNSHQRSSTPSGMQAANTQLNTNCRFGEVDYKSAPLASTCAGRTNNMLDETLLLQLTNVNVSAICKWKCKRRCHTSRNGFLITAEGQKRVQ